MAIQLFEGRNLFFSCLGPTVMAANSLSLSSRRGPGVWPLHIRCILGAPLVSSLMCLRLQVLSLSGVLKLCFPLL